MPKIPGYSRDNANSSLGFLDLHISWLNQPLLTTSNVLFNSLTTTDSLTVGGNLTVNGETTIINTNVIDIEDNIVKINSGQTGNVGVTLNLSGIEVERGDLLNFQSVYEESTDLYKIGYIGSLQAVATREDLPLNKGVMVYDSVSGRLLSRTTIELPITFSSGTSSNTSSTGSIIVSGGGGIGVSGNISLDNFLKFKGSNGYSTSLTSDILDNFIVNTPQNFIFQQVSGTSISIPSNVFLTFSSSSKTISTNGTDLIIVNSTGNINLTTQSAGSVLIPVSTYLEWSSLNRIRYNGVSTTFESSGIFDFNNIVNINSTVSSSSSATGSLLLNGGIGIANTTNATSSINGGTITTSGGLGVLKKTFIGESITIGDSASITASQTSGQGVNLRSNNRTIVTTSTNDLAVNSFEGALVSTSATIPNASTVYIAGAPTVSGGGTLSNTFSLFINNGVSKINSSGASTSSSSGSLLLNGGIGIANTTNATSSSNGGTITTAGGLGVLKKVYIGESLIVGDTVSVSITQTPEQGVNFRSINRTLVTNSSNDLSVNTFEGSVISTSNTISNASTVYISRPPTVSGGGTLTNKYALWVANGSTRLDGMILVNDTSASTSPTTGAITLNGGVGIDNTTDAVNENNGGTVTTAGGVAIKKKLFVGSQIASNSGVGNDYYALYNSGNKRFSINLINTESGSNIGSDLTIKRYSDDLSSQSNAFDIIRNSGDIKINSVTTSTSSSIGALVIQGGIGINNATEATSNTNGGSLTTLGGASIAKSLFIGTNLNVTGISSLRKTTINTIDGSFQVSGTNGLDFNVGSTSSIVTTSGSLTLDSQAASVVINGTAGVTIDSASGISIDAGAMSNFSTSTGTLNFSGVGVNVNSNSGIMSLSSTNNINLTSSAQNINLVSTSGDISLQSNSNVFIGNSVSTVVIGDNLVVSGDLLVSGTTTTVNSTIVTIADNGLILNSSPMGTSDGGLLIKRYQVPNNTGTGEVITDTPKETGAFQAGSSTTATLILSSSANATDSYYNGWWIKITSGTGINQVRRIKTYVGSTKTATIYVTGEPDGLNLTTAPGTGDTYSLYNRYFASIYHNELSSEIRFAFIPENQNSGVFMGTVEYADIHANSVILEGTISSSGITSSGRITVNYTDPSSFVVTKSGNSGNIFNIDSTNSIFTFSNPVNITNSSVLLNLSQNDNVSSQQIYSQIKSSILNNTAGNLRTRLDIKVQKDTSGLVDFVSIFGETAGNSYVEFNQNSDKVKIQSILTDSLEMQGGIKIFNTTNSTSSTVGGTITTLGGAAIAKDVYIGGNLNVTGNFSAGIESLAILTLSNQSNITSISYNNVVLSRNSTHRILEATFRIQTTTSSEYVTFDVLLPEVAANFANTFSTNISIQGFYDDASPVSIENSFGHSVSGTKTIRLKFTGNVNTGMHTIYLVANYST